jgi:hypothetical protein
MRYNELEFDRIYLGGPGPRPLPAIAPINPPLPWGYGMTPDDMAAMDEADADPFPPAVYGMTPKRAAALKWLKDIQNIPATTPASVVDPADACADPDPMGDGSAWGWVTVATIGALVALVAIVAWVTV